MSNDYNNFLNCETFKDSLIEHTQEIQRLTKENSQLREQIANLQKTISKIYSDSEEL